MKKYIAAVLLVGLTVVSSYADDDWDDIYYNPKKEAKSEKKKSNYIADFGNVDIDAYNRRGTYYESPIDTIGARAEAADDFVYTQMIQKYYNPTIVVDNSNLLEDILENSYGNVEIVYNGLTPVFMPTYSYPYYWNYPYWGFSWNYGGWNISYNPWYWGSPWGWNNPWNWGWGWNNPWNWGPSWGYDWGWSRPHYAYRPNGNRPVGPRPGWSDDTRPGGNYYGGHHIAGRPGYNARPGNANMSSRPVTNNHRQMSTIGGDYRPGKSTGMHRRYSTNEDRTMQSADRISGFGTYNGHRSTANRSDGNNRVFNSTINGSVNTNRTGVSPNRRSTTNTHRSTTTNRTTTNRSSYNSGSNHSTSRSSFGTSTGGSHHSSGGGGRSSGGGGGRGRHR